MGRGNWTNSLETHQKIWIFEFYVIQSVLFSESFRVFFHRFTPVIWDRSNGLPLLISPGDRPWPFSFRLDFRLSCRETWLFYLKKNSVCLLVDLINSITPVLTQFLIVTSESVMRFLTVFSQSTDCWPRIHPFVLSCSKVTDLVQLSNTKSYYRN